MFRSFLKSMQTKSQDAQNPGLWVNGNRMPMQEELARKLDPSASSFFKPKSGQNNYLQLVAPPVDADGNREVTPEEAARSAALSAEIDASVKADRVRAQLQDQDKVVTDTRDPLKYAKEPTYDELDQRAASITRRRKAGQPVYSPDSAYEQDQNAAKAVVAGLQENTKRSMFLTHLQGMQTKSQNAQNPGLWVNGNRMPVQESLLGAAVRGIGQVAKFGYDLGNNLGNGMMNTANTAVTGSSLKPYPQPSLLPPAPLQPSIRPPRFDPPAFKPTDSPPPNPRLDPRYTPRPSPRPNDRYIPRPGDRLPGLINPKPKSPTEITVDDIINPNTGNVSLSTGEANKPGAVTLYPAGQNILNPRMTGRSIVSPGLDGGAAEEAKRQFDRWRQENPDQNIYQKPERIDRTIGGAGNVGQKQLQKDRMDRLRKKVNSGEPLGIIPPTDPNLMNRMY
jgi:hypothetical protein